MKSDGPTVIPGSTRADGTLRKAVRIRPGYVPKGAEQKYVPPAKRDDSKKTIFITRPYYGPYPHQMTEEELSRWLSEKLWLKKC